MARSASLSAGGINIQFRVNQQYTSISKILPASGDLNPTYTLYAAQLLGIENYLKGNKIGIVISPVVAGVHCAIQAIMLVGEIAPMPEFYELGGPAGAGGSIITVGPYPPMNLGKMVSDPDTTGWGTTEEGIRWYNTTDHHEKMWNGTIIVLVG
jgi:hypothetical protein